MLRSMTGFGTASGEAEGFAITIELRSVNNRYLRVGMKMPESLSALESEIDTPLRDRLARGAVTATIRLRRTAAAAQQLNVDVLSGYIDQLRFVEIDANPLLRIDLGSLLNLPGVIETDSQDDLASSVTPTLLKVLDTAIDDLTKMRTREGEALGKDLSGQCQAVLASLNVVAQRSPQVIVDYHEKLRQRVSELVDMAKVRLDAETLAREVALFAERSDISEEISRLRGHVEQFTHTMADSVAPAGRKLDFIAQEMLREANTIGSKANDAETIRAVLEIKTAVDRIKEQVQNVE